MGKQLNKQKTAKDDTSHRMIYTQVYKTKH